MTVRVLTGVKRSASNHGHAKNNNKRSYLTEGQSSITHTGSPVNPMTAKALASKLNERNNILNGARKAYAQGTDNCNSVGTVNDIPIPPLICIQTTSTSKSNRFQNGGDSQIRDSSTHRSKFSQNRKKSITVDGLSASDRKQQNTEISYKPLNGRNSKMVKTRTSKNCV